MYKIICMLILLTIMTGCSDEIEVTPSRVETRVTRDGNVKLMCPIVDLVYDIVDDAISSPYCELRTVVGSGPRSYYDSHLYGLGTIMYSGRWFWFERGVITNYSRKLY